VLARPIEDEGVGFWHVASPSRANEIGVPAKIGRLSAIRAPSAHF
jgi:hypothetical protein